MEALYTKLDEKYNSLKTKMLSELDDLNSDQEVKFLNYVSVAEDLMNHLKEQSDSLCSLIADLRSELTSTRSAKDETCAEYQNLLTDANHKNKLLFDEIEKLQKLVREGQACSSKDGKDDETLSEGWTADELDVIDFLDSLQRKKEEGKARDAKEVEAQTRTSFESWKTKKPRTPMPRTRRTSAWDAAHSQTDLVGWQTKRPRNRRSRAE